ncbi:DUF3800 domain-containing protein [Mesorhizobium sp. M4B.F.Ca.ET.215.01.1.1]|uniref:DUF3800 domain-containing protein n=3 Tax=Mesorhizobium TaxID=68287 RepID=UPI000FCC59F9|nr:MULTISPECIES: DUF3800 domain-containing protein [unclassified Mesorhizobium]RUW22237.1 DUF3800 domain-containing protein [Mesorhizobium sp. M4B.F.Ca.ET.013.02.1.1]RVD45290.1 DUF3800 domain-containing protein [Mesorhizobium sp. M4B.F.Ca.ET.019.03.1.1]TGQ15361.1 DUF3800 domain-containing protein [Mesorhizobium sp. M4B.F.Ca.ET.215.01.1.1]TGQ48430.1 DUF3800 domain-containing protein [Mesorhizobium sp. M00.F.Ca.ET.220.01.1.1]TGR11425.1 DUF3800 domain-containing protein [Mesorhizobium sp. M4B.F.C
MAHTYVAYIDESGDDGLDKPFRQVGNAGGSSKWLIISACLFRQTHTLDAVRWRDEINAKMPERQSRTLHFAKLHHGQKLAAVQTIASKPLRALSVVAAKEPIPPDIYVEKNQLYFYMTRYLIERLSWLCRDHRPQAAEGDGRVAITFSRRGGMQYDEFRAYLERLKADESGEVRIHWPVIDIGAVSAADHSKSASLQLADAIASAMAAGFEPDRYGNCEPRYAETLKPITYHRKKNYLSYGVKIVPPHDECGLNQQQLKMVEIWK